MALFLLFGPPFFVWYTLETRFPDWDRREGLRTFLMGGLVILPFLFLHGFLRTLFPISVEGWSLFAKGLLIDLALPLLYIMAGYVWWYRKRIVISLPEQVGRFLTFGAGGMIPIAFQAHLSFRGWEEGFQYLLIPFLWIQLVCLGALLLGVWFSTVRWERILVMGAGIVWTLLLGWFSYLYRINYRSISWIFILGSFIAAAVMFPRLIEKLKYL